MVSRSVPLLYHIPLKIIVISLGDLYIYKISDREILSMYDYFIVYFHTVKFCTPEITARFFLINDGFESLPYFFLVELKRDFLLHFHYFLCTAFFFFL